MSFQVDAFQNDAFQTEIPALIIARLAMTDSAPVALLSDVALHDSLISDSAQHVLRLYEDN